LGSRAPAPSGPHVNFVKPSTPVNPSNTRVRAIAAEPHASPSRSDERELLARSREGDARAYRTLVERYQGPVYRLAFRIVRSERDAEEVAQDAFVRAWVGLREFRGDASFSTWIHRIVFRRALDRAALLRRRRLRETAIEGIDVEAIPAMDPPRASGVAGAAGGAVSREGLRLARLLGTLPETQRAVIALYYYEDYDVKEIAGILEIPEGTVKTHLSRARSALRRGWMRESRGETDHAL